MLGISSGTVRLEHLSNELHPHTYNTTDKRSHSTYIFSNDIRQMSW
ncbi:hypothetical protein [Nostoc cycadae]|nr:hypothetical protein [Nostoc cycadae]